jgi:hypothetical protein
LCCAQTKFYTFSKEKGRVAIDIGSIPIQIETSKQQSKDEYFSEGKERNTRDQGESINVVDRVLRISSSNHKVRCEE